ncbi:MAG TPA: DUF4129 domain-containing protein, partial [Roseiflexaceae bacterium]
WRGLLTLFGAIALVLALGLLVGSLVGDEAAAVVRLLWQGLVLIVALILAPFFYLAAAIVERLLRLLNLEQLLNDLNFQPPQPPAEGSAATDLLAIFPAWAQALIRAFFALLPILVVVGLILLARRRARRAASADEERESLWSWGGLAADLRGLLSNFGAPRRAEGLRDALARLRGADPATRVRRSYIRLLLLGQAHERPRAAPQTPREYAPAASAMLPAASQPIEALTDTYERARYHPQSLGAADATAAEQAWAAIDRAGRGQGG